MKQHPCRLILNHAIIVVILISCTIFISCADEGEERGPTSENGQTPPPGGQIPPDDGGEKPNGGVDIPDEPVERPVALPGLPDDVAGYEKWLKLNAKPIPPRAADPHNGTKNVYVNQERAAIAPNDQQKFPYPDGCTIVKESIRPDKDFVGLVAIMRKVKGSDPAHNDWKFVEYTRNAAGEAFREVARDAICWGCHSAVADKDYVYTPLE